MAKECACLVEEINGNKREFDLMGFVIDSDYLGGKNFLCGYPILGNTDWLYDHKDDVLCVCAVGYPKQRRDVMERLEYKGIQFTSLISPDTRRWKGFTFGDGCIIYPGCEISCDVSLGKGVFLSSFTVLGHDCNLKDYVTCFPKSQISGKCHINETASIGSMAFLNEGITVEAGAVVAPGSVVFTRVRENTYVMGNPAHKMSI